MSTTQLRVSNIAHSIDLTAYQSRSRFDELKLDQSQSSELLDKALQHVIKRALVVSIKLVLVPMKVKIHILREVVDFRACPRGNGNDANLMALS